MQMRFILRKNFKQENEIQTGNKKKEAVTRPKIFEQTPVQQEKTLILQKKTLKITLKLPCNNLYLPASASTVCQL